MQHNFILKKHKDVDLMNKTQAPENQDKKKVPMDSVDREQEDRKNLATLKASHLGFKKEDKEAEDSTAAGSLSKKDDDKQKQVIPGKND